MKKCRDEKPFEPCRKIPVVQIIVGVKVNRCIFLFFYFAFTWVTV